MKLARHLLALASAVALTAACSKPVPDADAVPRTESHLEQMEEKAMKIKIVAGDRTLTARLDDSAAGRDFAALLPLDLTLRDYNRTEKIADLPQRLSTEGAPEGYEPVTGDIAYYAPWGNVAIFYRGFDYSRGLVPFGRIDQDGSEISRIEGLVRIEKAPIE